LEATVSKTACVFCDIVRGEAPGSLVYSDHVVIAFMDIRPVNPGHLLVVPRAHARHLADMHLDTGAHLFCVGMRLAAALRRSGVRCEGVDLFLADGEAAGQEVFHVHLHVIPRYWSDGFGFRFGPGYDKLPARAELNDVAAGIRAAVED
jgi:histidine triad (HIT) family protein